MAKIIYQEIPEELKNIYKKSLQIGDRFVVPRISVKRMIPRRKLIKGITQKSKLPEIAEAWKNLSGAVQTAWASVGVVNGMTGYKAFTKEYILRLQNSLTPITTPSVYHHGEVGKIIISAPANDLRIRQDHPTTYYINAKVRGTRNQYEPKKVTEFISFPFTLSINYKSNLTTTSVNNKARIYIQFLSNYQGRDISTIKEINFDLVSDWKNAELEIANVFGVLRAYTLYIDFLNVQGEFLFDNVKVYHSGKNWVRDTFCNDIHQDFTKAFYQVAKHWIGEIVPDGANFESVYPE